MISILVLIYVVFISLGLPDSVFGVAWPVVHTQFGIPESFASIYSIVTGVCSGGASFVAGIVLRKFGTPKVTFVSIILTAIGLLGISFSPNIWIMMLFTVVLGYGAGAIDTGLNNYVSLHFKAKHMSWLHCFWGIGVTLSPIIMSFFLKGENGNWRNGYRIIALIQGLIALAVGIMLPKWIKKDNEQKIIENNPQSEKAKLFEIKGVIVSILSLGFYCVMEFVIGTWGASFAVNEYSLPASTSARWVSIYYGGIMLGRLISGFLSEKIGDDGFIRFGSVISLSGMIFLALHISNISLIGLFFIGLGFGPIFPSVLHSIPTRFGKRLSADITGFHMGGAYAIGFFAQLIFGYVATATTFAITPYLLIVSLIFMNILNEIAIKKTHTKSIFFRRNQNEN